MKWYVLKGFVDLDGTTKLAGTIVDMDPSRAATLRAIGIIGGSAEPQPAASIRLLIAGAENYTPTREENVAGLASALALAAGLKTSINAHYADVTEHTAGADAAHTLVLGAPYDIPTLIASITEMMASYVLHDDDAELGAAWAYHAAQEAGNHSLASVAAPINLQECITRLNDIQAKYNGHDADGTAHGTDTLHQNATAAAAYGATILIALPAVAPGDYVLWSILNDGTGNVTGVSAVAVAGGVQFTFSADPQNDAIISFGVAR